MSNKLFIFNHNLNLKDMIYTYYVYFGIKPNGDSKIGCTTEFEKRISDQGLTNCEILWQQEGDWDFGWIAGNKEIELQKMYGVKVDKIHYQISRENRRNMGISGGSAKGCSKLLKEHLDKARKPRNGGLATKLIKKTCPHCDRSFDVRNYAQHHGDKCKYNPNKNKIT